MRDDTIAKDVETMWKSTLTRKQELLRRSLLADVPDSEIEAYGTDEQIEDAFGEPIDPEEKQIAKQFVDAKFEEIYESGFHKLYWDREGYTYIILF